MKLRHIFTACLTTAALACSGSAVAGLKLCSKIDKVTHIQCGIVPIEIPANGCFVDLLPPQTENLPWSHITTVLMGHEKTCSIKVDGVKQGTVTISTKKDNSKGLVWLDYAPTQTVEAQVTPAEGAYAEDIDILVVDKQKKSFFSLF